VTRDTQIKIALTLAGLVIWLYGAKAENTAARWVGIILIASAFLMRFFRPRA
jgi:hypothetical protein